MKHHFDPEQKSSSMQLKARSSPSPKEGKDTTIERERYPSFWGDCEDIIMTDYIWNMDIQSLEILLNFLDTTAILVKKRRWKQRERVLLLYDNAIVHQSVSSIQTPELERGYEILPHPPYSSGLTPSDFFLFPKFEDNSHVFMTDISNAV